MTRTPHIFALTIAVVGLGIGYLTPAHSKQVECRMNGARVITVLSGGASVTVSPGSKGAECHSPKEWVKIEHRAAEAKKQREAEEQRKKEANLQTEKSQKDHDALGFNYAIQIAATRSEAHSQDAWKELARRFDTLRESAGAVIVPPEYGTPGWYRLVLPSNSKGAALSACQSLKAEGGDCFVVWQGDDGKLKP